MGYGSVAAASESRSGLVGSLRERRPVLFWLAWAGPPLLLMTVIFLMGGDRGASGESRGMLSHFLARIAPWLYERLSPDQLEAVNHYLRKTVHFTVYAVLAILDARALHGACGRLMPGLARGAFAAAVAWASVDEFHQSFFPSRGGSPYDVLLDASGAAAGSLVYYLWIRRTSHSR